MSHILWENCAEWGKIMQNLVRSNTIGVTGNGGRGTAGASPGRDLLYVLRVQCPGPLGSCSPGCPLGALLCICGVLGHLAPVHRCARSVCCLCVPCPAPLGSCSPVCALGVLFCLCRVLGHLAPVHRCARSVRCFACAMSWATWLLPTGVPALCIVLLVRCPRSLGSCSPVCALGALLCVCGVLSHLAPVHLCARLVRCLCVRCPGPLGSCSPVCPLGVFFCLCSVLGHLAPVHRCARLVCCVACAVSWATWLLFTGVPARCVVLRVRCPGPLGSCSGARPLGVLCCVCGVLGHLAPVHRFARSVCCVACAVSWAPWLLFTGVLARCVVLWVACAGCRCGALTRPSGQFVANRGWVPFGAHSSVWTAAVRSRQGLGTLRAHTRPSGRRLFRSRQGFRSLPDSNWCCLAPVLVPWFVVCCARSPGLRHLAAVAAWHLFVCLGCGRRRASLACLVAPRYVPGLVQSSCSRCSGRLSRCRRAFPHPRSLRPRLYWVAARGTRRLAENRAHCACHRPPPRQGR